MLVLTVISLAVAVGALVLAGSLWRDERRRQAGDDRSGLPDDVLGLRREVAALRAEAAGSLRHLAVVRYDAYGDMGGHLSWTLALLDDGGEGVVVTSIHGRSDARTYAKSISGWTCDQQLSPEEDEAIAHARP